MAFSGGVYTLPAGNPVTTNTTIESNWANTTLNDIATALSTCVLKDGTQTLTANIPMGGFKLTGMAAGSASTDSVRVGQLQDNTVSYLTGTAGTNTITASGTPTVTALTAGQRFSFIPANTNTGATTLQINSTAATNIFWNNAALVGGEIRANVPVTVFYDGAQYQLLSSAAMANTYAIPDVMRIQSAGDRTKEMIFNVSGVATGATVTLAVPSTGGTIATTLFVSSVAGPVLTVFSGSGTWTKTTGLKSIFVEVWAAGGGGAASNGATTMGGGGAAGGYARSRVAAGSLGATEAVTIGAFGSGGGSAGAAGSTGGTSSFGSHATATGGGGGTSNSNGGLGGVGAGNSANGTGAPGGAGNGGSVVPTNLGGSSSIGGGGRPTIGGGNGAAASGYGGGGAGAINAGAGDSIGGNGTPGLVIVAEFY